MFEEVEYGEFGGGLGFEMRKGEVDIVVEAGWTEEAARVVLL
jgi:hypothetical protein